MAKVVDLCEARKKLEKQKQDDAYKQAIARILERAKKLDW